MLTKSKLLACGFAAAAVGFCSVASAVDTKASLYGDIRIGFSDSDDSDVGPPAFGGGGSVITHTQGLHDSQSFWGIKASASSGHLTGFGQYERLVDTDNVFGGTSHSLAGGGGDLVRQAFLGVACDLAGTIAAGTMETAYSKAARRYDPFYNTGVSDPLSLSLTPALYGATAIGGTTFGAGQSFGGSVMSYPVLGGAFVDNQVAYTSPSFFGASVNVAYINDDDQNNLPNGVTGKSDDDWAYGVDFNWQGITAGFQQVRIRSASAVNSSPTSTGFNFGWLNGTTVPTGVGVDIDTTLLEAGFSTSLFGVGATWERIDYKGVGVGDQDNMQLAGWFGILPDTRLAATVGDVNNLLEAGGGGVDLRGFTVGVFHDVVENFTAHVAYAKVESGGDPSTGATDSQIWTVGASYKFSLGTGK